VLTTTRWPLWASRSGALTVQLASGTTLITIGQKTMANSFPVVLASDQSALTVASHAVTNAGTFATQDSQVLGDDSAFTIATSKVWSAGFLADETATDSVDEGDIGAARMTLDRIQWTAPATVTSAAQAATACYVQGGTGTTASTNAANCKASAGNFYGVRAVNTTATFAYLRLYNLATAPTCSSATGFVETIPIPANATGAGIVSMPAFPFNYTTGIAYCVTGGATSTDNTNSPAGVFITLAVK
jgi:hypothetical protein